MMTMSPGEGRHEDLLDVSREELAVDRPVEHAGRIDPVMAQGGHEGQGLPLSERSLGEELAAALRPAPDRGHVGLGPDLVDEHKSPWIKAPLILLPLRPSPRDLWVILFGCEQAFF
jgi:hypothetical protein